MLDEGGRVDEVELNKGSSLDGFIGNEGMVVA